MKWDDLTAHDRKKALQSLIDSKGWALLTAIWHDQIKMRTDEVILKPSHEFEGGYIALEFMKGEIANLRAVLNLPQVLLEAASEEAQTLAEKEVDDDDPDLADTDHPEDSDDWTG